MTKETVTKLIPADPRTVSRILSLAGLKARSEQRGRYSSEGFKASGRFSSYTTVDFWYGVGYEEHKEHTQERMSEAKAALEAKGYYWQEVTDWNHPLLYVWRPTKDEYQEGSFWSGVALNKALVNGEIVKALDVPEIKAEHERREAQANKEAAQRRREVEERVQRAELAFAKARKLGFKWLYANSGYQNTDFVIGVDELERLLDVYEKVTQ